MPEVVSSPAGAGFIRRPEPQARNQRILDDEEPSQLLDRRAEHPRPRLRATGHPLGAVAAGQFRGDPGRRCESMRTSPRFKTCVLHNVPVKRHVEPHPDFLGRPARLAAEHHAGTVWERPGKG